MGFHTQGPDGGSYYPFHITATQATAQPVTYPVSGRIFYQTTTTTIVGGALATVVVSSTSQMQAGRKFTITNGGSSEIFTVTQVVDTTHFTAIFVGSYSGTSTITSINGTYLGAVIINNPGTTASLTLYNGHPSGTPAGTAIAVIALANGEQTRPYNCKVEHGLYYTLSGSGSPDITVMFIDDPTLR